MPISTARSCAARSCLRPPRAGASDIGPGTAHSRPRLLAGITEPFFVLDDHWRFAYVNEPAAAVLGRPNPELLGRVIWDAFPEAAGSKFEQVALQVAESGEPMRFTERYAPEGRTFSSTVSPAPGGITVYFHATRNEASGTPLAST